MVNKDVDALAESEIIHENRELLVLYLPWNWQELVAETGALKGLRTDESAEHLLCVLPLHFGHRHSRHGTAQRGPASGTRRSRGRRAAKEIEGLPAGLVRGTGRCQQVGHFAREHGGLADSHRHRRGVRFARPDTHGATSRSDALVTSAGGRSGRPPRAAADCGVSQVRDRLHHFPSHRLSHREEIERHFAAVSLPRRYRPLSRTASQTRRRRSIPQAAISRTPPSTPARYGRSRHASGRRIHVPSPSREASTLRAAPNSSAGQAVAG